MSPWKFGGGFVIGSALAATAVFAGAPPSSLGAARVSELVDPAFIARSVCGPSGARAGMFRPRVQLAAASATRIEAGDDDGPPLWDNLGDLTYPITTADELAQRYFDQGLRLAYGFNHPEALRAFRKARRIDPTCAMCAWGEALVLGPNINAPMEPSAVIPAFSAVTRAQELAGDADLREQSLIAALAKRYSADPDADRVALDTAYAQAMAEVTARFPDDDNIAVFYAESLMNLSPWDYWEADGSTSKGRTAELVRTLERVLARNPDHPGAIHFYIHTVEASTTPERAEPYADRLGALIPGAGHLVHMPSHIYYRVGRYLDSLDANRDAVAADEAYLARSGSAGIYASGYYPHNIHFLLVSAQMAGDRETAMDAAKQLDGKISDEVARSVPWIQLIKGAPYFAHAQMSDRETVLSVPDPGDTFPYVKAVWHYMRGVALASAGDVEAARGEGRAIVAIEEDTDFGSMIAGGVPVPDILRLAQHVVAARIAQAEGDLGTAATQFELAIAVEDSLPYLEPPYWYYPVRQSLGAVLLAAGKPAEAERAFQQSLIRTPNNGWALYGLREAQKAQGDAVAAQLTERLFKRAWGGDQADIDLARL